MLPEGLLDSMRNGNTTYFEPFLGAGAMFLAIQPATAVLSDVNPPLMNLWRAVQRDPYRLLAEVYAINRAAQTVRVQDFKRPEHTSEPDGHLKQYYYEMRSEFNRTPVATSSSAVVGVNWRSAALMHWLNHCCFNGLWRTNSRGEFNAPAGTHLSNLQSLVPDLDNLVSIAGILYHKALKQQDFVQAVAESTRLHSRLNGVESGSTWHGTQRGSQLYRTLQPPAFAYFDPPYDGTFANYSRGGFGQDAQAALKGAADAASRAGWQVMMSNADTEFIRHLWSFPWGANPGERYRLYHIQAPTCISRDPAKRGKRTELVVTNFRAQAVDGVTEVQVL